MWRCTWAPGQWSTSGTGRSQGEKEVDCSGTQPGWSQNVRGETNNGSFKGEKRLQPGKICSPKTFDSRYCCVEVNKLLIPQYLSRGLFSLLNPAVWSGGAERNRGRLRARARQVDGPLSTYNPRPSTQSSPQTCTMLLLQSLRGGNIQSISDSLLWQARDFFQEWWFRDAKNLHFPPRKMRLFSPFFD